MIRIFKNDDSFIIEITRDKLVACVKVSRPFYNELCDAELWELLHKSLDHVIFMGKVLEYKKNFHWENPMTMEESMKEENLDLRYVVKFFDENIFTKKSSKVYN